MNKKGFTLIELLGVIAILSMLMLIAIPSISGVIQRQKKQTYINDARKMVYLVKYEIKKGNINKPANGELVKITLDDLKTNEIEKDRNNNLYDKENSCVYITRENGELNYYAQLLTKKEDGSYEGIALTNVNTITDDKDYSSYSNKITEDKILANDAKLNENKKYQIKIITDEHATAKVKTLSLGLNNTDSVNIIIDDDYYLADGYCSDGFDFDSDVSLNEDEAIGEISIIILKDNTPKNGYCTLITKHKPVKHNLILNAENSIIKTRSNSNNTLSLEIASGEVYEKSTISITPDKGFFLADVQCTDGYKVDAKFGKNITNKQNITISSDESTNTDGTCQFVLLPLKPTVVKENQTYVITEPHNNALQAQYVDRYEIYVNDTKVTPSNSQAAIDSSTNNEILVRDAGNYVWFRAVYKNGIVSDWSDPMQLDN